MKPKNKGQCTSPRPKATAVGGGKTPSGKTERVLALTVFSLGCARLKDVNGVEGWVPVTAGGRGGTGVDHREGRETPWGAVHKGAKNKKNTETGCPSAPKEGGGRGGSERTKGGNKNSTQYITDFLVAQKALFWGKGNRKSLKRRTRNLARVRREVPVLLGVKVKLSARGQGGT